MSTPAIGNLFSGVLPGTPNGGKADATTPDGAFNQVLSREIENQNRGNTTNETAQGTKKDRPDADKAKNDASTADGSKPAEGAKASEDDKTAQATDGKTVKDDKKENDPATTASADIIAFVNALTQAAAGGNATPVAVASGDIKDRLAGLGDGKSDSKIDPSMFSAAASEKTAAAGKQPDFAATLDKAATAASSDKDGKAPTATAASSASKTAEADMAVAAQAVKTMEPATAPTPQNIAAAAIATTAALQHVNEAQDPQSNRLLPQVGTDDWGQALGQKITWMVHGAQQTATLTLNPPDLGPMQVVVHVNNNQATANFTAHQPEVRHALEAAMPRLREMLNESGIQLGQSNVSAGLPNQQNNASGDQRQNGRSSNQAGNAVETATVNVSHIPVSSAGTGLVDTFA